MLMKRTGRVSHASHSTPQAQMQQKKWPPSKELIKNSSRFCGVEGFLLKS
jgi:hypothetical protein